VEQALGGGPRGTFKNEWPHLSRGGKSFRRGTILHLEKKLGDLEKGKECQREDLGEVKPKWFWGTALTLWGTDGGGRKREKY